MQQWHFITCHMFSCYSDCCEGWREEDRHSLLFILISPCIPSLRHDEVKCLTVNRVSGVSLPEMIPLCDSDSDSCQPRLGTHAPVITRHPRSQKILMWHNINIRDVSQCCDATNKSFVTFPFIRFVSSSDWLSALSLYTFISRPKEVSRETGWWKNFYLIGQIHTETDKLTNYYWAVSG